MTRFSTRHLGAFAIAAGLLLSACGQSDASGRIRNSSLGEGCFATQAEKDNDVAFYEQQAEEARRLGENLDDLKKKQDDLGAAYTAMLPPAGETWPSLYAKIDNTSQAAVNEWNQMMEAVYQASLAAAAAAGEYAAASNEHRALPQYNQNLVLVRQRPVCVTTIPAASLPDDSETEAAPPDSSEPDTSTPSNSVSESASPETETTNDTTNTNANNQISKTNIAECQQPLEVTGGINQVIRIGETLEFIFPLCSTDSYVTLWGDFDTGLSVYSNEVDIENKPHVVFRLSSTQPLSGTFFFQQLDRISQTFSPKSQLDLTIVQPEEIQLCAGKAPNVEMSADGVLTAESTCEEADYIEIQVTNIKTGHTVVNVIVPETSDNYQQDGLSYVYGTEAHEVTAYHVQWARVNKPIVSRIGDVLTFQFQLKPDKKGESLPFEPLGIVGLPRFFDIEPNTESTSSPNKANESTTAKILIAPTTSGVSCGDACTTTVIQQSGVAPENVEKIEASVNGSAWVILTPDITLPLLDVTNTVAVRVTPKDGSKPVVLTNTLYRDAEALSGSDVAETIALSVGGEQTITAVPARAGISPAQTILLAVAVLILLVLAMLFLRTRRKEQV